MSETQLEKELPAKWATRYRERREASFIRLIAHQIPAEQVERLEQFRNSDADTQMDPLAKAQIQYRLEVPLEPAPPPTDDQLCGSYGRLLRNAVITGTVRASSRSTWCRRWPGASRRSPWSPRSGS